MDPRILKMTYLFPFFSTLTKILGRPSGPMSSVLRETFSPASWKVTLSEGSWNSSVVANNNVFTRDFWRLESRKMTDLGSS